MGNNNSSYGSGHISKSRQLQHDYRRGHGKWGASSDLGDPSGNRMKKGYLPTRGYHGQRLPSPHKVLPSMNPTSAAKLLKPTSNGAILHQGGTISGRKLLSELDPHSPEAEDLRRAMRKRSTASCPNGEMIGPASGRSTPNLSVMEYNGMMMERNGPRRASSKGGSSSRDYDSEPDLRDMDENHRDDSSPQRSMSPVPNSFTLIQESPAKKQIRSKKKGKAPPPPVPSGVDHIRLGGSDMPCCSPNSPQLLSPCGESKKASRLFKTKAESRHTAANGPRSPEICSDLEMSRGGKMRASMDANRFFRGERDRSSVHSVEAGLCTSKSSAMMFDHHNFHLSNRKHSEGGGVRKTSVGPAALLASSSCIGGSNSNSNNNHAGGALSSRNNPEVKNMTPLARDHASASPTKIISSSVSGGVGGSGSRPSNNTSSSANNKNTSSSNIIMINQSGATTSKDEHVPKSHRVVSSTNLIPPITPYGQSPSQSATNFINNSSSSSAGNPSSVNQKASSNNKGFNNNNISSSSSSSHQTKASSGNNNAPHQQNNQKPSLSNSGNGKVGSGTGNNNVHHGRRKTTNAPAVPTSAISSSGNNKNNNKENASRISNSESSNNKTMFYFGMDAQPPVTNTKPQTASTSAVQQSDSDNNNNEYRRDERTNERVIMNHHHHRLEKVSSTNSELQQIKQDSGSFDTSERQRGDGLQSQNKESSSELSSSDLDIPLNIRPTLPAKKLGLPRFSPTAAWRALDSPSRVSVSGRSYSSEEGYGHDRIQRYMRQIPPSRANSNNNNHERSAGDSGISAGDAGSPANPELIADASAATTPSTSNPAPVMNGGGRGYKLRATPGKHNGMKGADGKCWTPEQDLDESSSSEFEDQPVSPHQQHISAHPLHSSSNIATRVLPAGLGTPPKLTTRNNLFERGRNSALGMVSDSDQYHLERPGNLYVRSRKAMATSGGGSGASDSKPPANSQETHEDMKKSQIGASRYYRNIRSQPWRQANHLRQTGGNANGNREFVGLDTNWFLSRSEPNSLNLIGNGEYDNIEQQELRLVLAEQDDDEEDGGDEDDVEEELYLPAEDNKKPMNMHGGDHVNNDYDEVNGCGTRLESEIGYGPSSMSFSSPLPSPSAVKIRNVNRRKEQQLVSSNSGGASATAQVSRNLRAEEFERDQDIEMASPNSSANVRYEDNNNSSWERRPFSHIMYLPAYDSRRVPSSSSAVTRRTKSVDNLNFSEMTVYQPRKTSHYNNPISPGIGIANRQRRSRSPSDNGGARGQSRMTKRGGEADEPFERSQSVPPFTVEEENERRRRAQMEHQQNAKLHQQQQREREQLEREQKKKKFKFQSTLRVMERKKIEEQLSREAEEKERRRLQEQEAMRKVEEEFQRKRVREKVLEMEAAAKANQSNNNNNIMKGHHTEKIEMSNRYDVQFDSRSANPGGERERNVNNHTRGGNNARSSNISYNTNHHQMYQRQEPEGAPASTTNGPTGDLRKELICASRNRSGFPGATGKHSELTQELSEFCTPTGQRQYFDYRRAHDADGFNHRASSGPTTSRHYNSSSSSDIFPVTSRRDRKRGGGGSSVISSSKSSVGYLRPTVHPQVVCDIPVKPLPYVVNFSRLSSSNMDLLTEQDRPRSGLGGNASVLSDNYRKDWAHNSRGNGPGPVRASSVISLHSAPPLSNSEQFRHSSVDLTTASVLHTPPQSPRQSKYSTSPSASPVSQSRPLSSPEERFQSNHPSNDIPSSKSRAPGVTQELWDGDCVTGNKTVVMLNSPSSVATSSSPSVYQPAPYNRQKGFRPVDFNPNPGGLSPAHAFHHASAKLTTPTPVN